VVTSSVADVLAESLKRQGISTIFGQSLPSALFLAAERVGIRQLSYRTENAGGAMADGYARASGLVGVVGAQNGPAATLLVPPMAEALKASVPLLALVQDVPLQLRDRNAFQELDHLALFAPCAKWVKRLDDPQRAEDYLDMALVAAATGRGGPAVLLLPSDVLITPASSTSLRCGTFTRYPLDRTRPARDQVEQAAKLLAEASNPVIIAGGGVHLSGASAELAQIQTTAVLPVATTNMGKGAVAEINPLSIGVVGNYMGKSGATRDMRPLISNADVVLLIGSRTNENGTDSWKLLPRGAHFIHIDIDGMEIGRNYEAIRLVGDAKLALADLIDALGRQDLTRRRSQKTMLEASIAQAKSAYARVTARVAVDAVPIRPEQVMKELDRFLSADTIVVSDASYSTIWMNNCLTARAAGQRFISPRGLAGLGWGLPLALGAQAAFPERQVVCIAGDGGFGHVWGELETAVREQLPVTIILLNNGILGFQKHAELVKFGAHTNAIGLRHVDHSAIAAAAGMLAWRVEDPSQVSECIERAMNIREPALVEIICDPDAYPPITAWDDNTRLSTQ
jgi:acetolactate synthase-1/2/3 large subunit